MLRAPSGSRRAAGVPARFDAMLADWASPETRTALVEALDRIDVAARTARGKNFAALSAAERAEVLRPHDAAALVKVPPKPGAPKSHPFAPVAPVLSPVRLPFHEVCFHDVGIQRDA